MGASTMICKAAWTGRLLRLHCQLIKVAVLNTDRAAQTERTLKETPTVGKGHDGGNMEGRETPGGAKGTP